MLFSFMTRGAIVEPLQSQLQQMVPFLLHQGPDRSSGHRSNIATKIASAHIPHWIGCSNFSSFCVDIVFPSVFRCSLKAVVSATKDPFYALLLPINLDIELHIENVILHDIFCSYAYRLCDQYHGDSESRLTQSGRLEYAFVTLLATRCQFRKTILFHRLKGGLHSPSSYHMIYPRILIGTADFLFPHPFLQAQTLFCCKDNRHCVLVVEFNIKVDNLSPMQRVVHSLNLWRLAE